MSPARESTELKPRTPWQLLGKWLVLIVSLSFWTIWTVLGFALRFEEFQLFWVIAGIVIFVGLILVLFLVTGPLYGPSVRSVTVGSDSLLVEEPEGQETHVAFPDIQRIASSSVAMTVVLRSGTKYVLGYGFGGKTGDLILERYRQHAERNGIELLEYETRGMTSQRVRNLEVRERRH